MYFNNNRKDTNIDAEFKDNKNILSTILNFLNKYKIFIIAAAVLLLIILMIVLFTSRKEPIFKVTTSLELLGEETITLYQGSDYVEPGYNAYNSKEEDLTKEVNITSNLNINKIGEYEITYTLGEITKIRKINVIEKTKEYTYILLNTVNNSVDIYLKIGDKYNEPGYKVFNSAGKNLNGSVKVTGNIDTSKKGTYKLTYTVIDSNNVTVSKTRNVIVMDTDISLSLNTKSYTNGKITINITVADDYFDYILLPDKTKVTKSTYSYNVSQNGTYTFTVYNSKGMSKTSSIEVNNIDKTAPTGSCTIDENNNGSIIKITASDAAGIQKYVYNNKSYTNKTINLSQYITSATVTIYDNANNTKNISCKVVPKVYISSIEQDGVIITVNAKKISSEIAGYYFSYTSTRPDKSGGYIETNQTSIDVVRLPGTTYVWVEDKSGKISSAKTITLTNDVLFSTTGSKYKILQGTKLSTYLSNQGWSEQEFENLIARSARAAGLYTKTAAATSAVALQTVLAQKYQIKLPYWWGGKSWSTGIDGGWGKKYSKTANGQTYKYYGLDCSGFITWAYVNAGYKIPYNTYPHEYYWGRGSNSKTKVSINKNNGDIGDWLVNSGHIKMIVGKTETGYITAEARGNAYGMVISTQSYSNPGNYKVVIADKFIDAYSNKKYDLSSYPSGF